MADRDRWIVHIKELRSKHGVSLIETERIALSDPQWHRWVARQIDTDKRCRKTALFQMRIRGAEALVYKDGDVLKVRKDPELWI